VCYDQAARPPLPPIAGGAGEAGGGDIVLTAGDGNRLAAYSASHGRRGGPGIVILPDIRGLHPFYQELAVRFAQAGIHATAFDYFGRTAGIGSGEARGPDFDWAPHIEQTRPETIAADVAAAVAHVRSGDGGGASAVFTVGFCFGGRASFNQAAAGHGLAGVIGFYGRVAERNPGDQSAPVLLAGSYACPVLGLFGGADPGITREDIESFRQALESAGVPNEIQAYDGAPHSFFDRTHDEHREACEDAWRRILGFVEARSRG
jgi:carboxymethylenebutenolidase